MENMKEIWKTIPDYPYYKASTKGQIKGVDNFLLKPFINKGYKVVTLWKNKKGKKLTISRIVFHTFKQFDLADPCIIDHIDTIKTNNNLYNLQKLTHRENDSKDRINKTGYTGVRKASKNTYTSTIQINGKRIALSGFKTPKECSIQYQLAVKYLKEYRGDNKEFRQLLKNKMNE